MEQIDWVEEDQKRKEFLKDQAISIVFDKFDEKTGQYWYKMVYSNIKYADTVSTSYTISNSVT